MYAFTKPADFEFSREKVLRLAEQQVHGVTSLEGQLSSAWTSDLFTHVITRVVSSQRLTEVTRAFALVPHEHCSCNQGSAVILNSSETSGPRSNGRILKMYILEVYTKSFGGQRA